MISFLRLPARLLALAIGLVCIAATQIAAADRSWRGPASTSGDWSTASNWSPTGVPSSIDNVVIDNIGIAGITGQTAAAANVVVGGRTASALWQTSGTLTASQLSVFSGSRYRLADSLLGINSRFDLTGQLDFAGTASTVSLASSGTIDWSMGTILAASNASVSAGAGSTIYLPNGFNPYTTFKSFTSLGDVFNTSGPLLIVPAGFVMNAVSDRTDKMRIEGTLKTKDQNGYWSDFRASSGGVEVASGGLFSTGDSSGYAYSLRIEANSSITGGTLQSRSYANYIGTTNKPTTFTQSGGAFNVAAGDGTSGILYVQNGSRYEQSGGALSIGQDMQLSNGSRYVISGGTATIGDELVLSAAGDMYQQSGGAVTVANIRGRTGSRLDVTGGSLAVGKRFELATSAVLDFGSGTASISVPGYGVVDLAAGTVSNAGNASYTAGVQSESYFPAGFNPYTAFKNFSSQGLVHTAGTTLVVPGNFVMNAVADRTDKMRIEGTLKTKDQNGYWSDFRASSGGVEVASGGLFSTGDSSGYAYSLRIEANSSITGGTLQSRSYANYIGTTNKPTTFTQSGGAFNVAAGDGTSGILYVQNGSRYEQSGGALSIGQDMQLSNGSRYVISGGTATIGDELVLSAAGDMYQQSGGAVTVANIRGRTGSRLDVTGGSLAVGKRFELATSAVLDFGSGTASISVPGYGVVDLAAGTVSNAGNASYTAGVQSESYFPAGFNPYTAFKNFSSQGLVHSTNTRIVVPSSYSGQAQRLVAQSVEVRGTLGIQAGGAITSSADVTVAGGRLTGGGTVSAVSVINSGVIAPGFSPGKLTMNSAFTQTATGRLSLEVEGTGRGTTYDWVAVSGATTLGGALDVSSTTHPRLPIGTTFDVLTASAVTGTFADFTDETYLGLRWNVVGGNTLRLTTTADGSGDFVLDVRAGVQSQADVGRPRIAAAKSVVKTGAGTLVFSASNTYQGQTTIREGVLELATGHGLTNSQIQVDPNTALRLSPGVEATVAAVSGNGALDVSSGRLNVITGISEQSVVAMLAAGRNGGDWNGAAGVISSAVAAEVAAGKLRTVGWMQSDSGGFSFAYAAPGDTNLDWVIDVLDVANLLSSGKFETGMHATWSEGDFNYDGVLDVLDIADFSATSLYGAANYNAPAITVMAVPEPAGLGLTVCGVGGLLIAAGRYRGDRIRA